MKNKRFSMIFDTNFVRLIFRFTVQRYNSYPIKAVKIKTDCK